METSSSPQTLLWKCVPSLFAAWLVVGWQRWLGGGGGGVGRGGGWTGGVGGGVRGIMQTDPGRSQGPCRQPHHGGTSRRCLQLQLVTWLVNVCVCGGGGGGGRWLGGEGQGDHADEQTEVEALSSPPTIFWKYVTSFFLQLAWGAGRGRWLGGGGGGGHAETQVEAKVLVTSPIMEVHHTLVCSLLVGWFGRGRGGDWGGGGIWGRGESRGTDPGRR